MPPANPTLIEKAAAMIRRGELVAFPTETVYGLGANATNPMAISKIFEVKGRPRFDPLIVHVSSPNEATALWTECPREVQSLMTSFWPGPLTLVLPKTTRIPDIVTAGLPTVAVRMPDHAIALSLIQKAGCPIAAPSANRFNRPSPTTAQAVEEELGQKVDLILDGGPARIGVESTVLSFKDGKFYLLRPGGIPLESLQEKVGPIQRPPTQNALESPGMLERHYAPTTPLYILREGDLNETLTSSLQGEIGFLSLNQSIEYPFAHECILSPSENLVEAASRFFQCIRELDTLRLGAIVAMPFPVEGLGLALMDRLNRAAVGSVILNQGQFWRVEK